MKLKFIRANFILQIVNSTPDGSYFLFFSRHTSCGVYFDTIKTGKLTLEFDFLNLSPEYLKKLISIIIVKYTQKISWNKIISFFIILSFILVCELFGNLTLISRVLNLLSINFFRETFLFSEILFYHFDPFFLITFGFWDCKIFVHCL